MLYEVITDHRRQTHLLFVAGVDALLHVQTCRAETHEPGGFCLDLLADPGEQQEAEQKGEEQECHTEITQGVGEAEGGAGEVLPGQLRTVAAAPAQVGQRSCAEEQLQQRGKQRKSFERDVSGERPATGGGPEQEEQQRDEESFRKAPVEAESA